MWEHRSVGSAGVGRGAATHNFTSHIDKHKIATRSPYDLYICFCRASPAAIRAAENDARNFSLGSSLDWRRASDLSSWWPEAEVHRRPITQAASCPEGQTARRKLYLVLSPGSSSSPTEGSPISSRISYSWVHAISYLDLHGIWLHPCDCAKGSSFANVSETVTFTLLRAIDLILREKFDWTFCYESNIFSLINLGHFVKSARVD
jgi:hypothetical protein